MTLNAAEVHAIVEELKSLEGTFLQGVFQPTRDRLLLGFAGAGHLLLVPRGPFARLHLVSERTASPKQPFSFQGACRAHLGGRLERVSAVPGDRVVDLAFSRGALHLRLTGRGGGLWLLVDGRVVAAYDGPATDALPELPVRAPSLAPPRALPPDGMGWNAWMAERFARAERDSALAARRQEIARALRRRVDQLERLAEALDADLERCAQAPGLRRMADALAAHLHTVRKGAHLVTLPDLEDPELSLHVPLDPAHPPAFTLNRLYARAGRLDRAADRVLQQLDDTASELASLRARIVQVDEATPEVLEAWRATLPRATGRARPGPALPWDEWVGPRGERVWVGRNAASNRKLTFQKARGSDWWMHLRDRPGAHLVLPVARGQSPHLPHLLAAAELCLRAARVAEGALAEVQYTQVRHLKSVPGSASAEVLVHEERVLAVRRSPEALQGWTRTLMEERAPG